MALFKTIQSDACMKMHDRNHSLALEGIKFSTGTSNLIQVEYIYSRLSGHYFAIFTHTIRGISGEHFVEMVERLLIIIKMPVGMKGRIIILRLDTADDRKSRHTSIGQPDWKLMLPNSRRL